MYLPFLLRTGEYEILDFILRGTLSTKTAFSGNFYEKSVEAKDAGNRENGVHGGVWKRRV